MPDSFLLCSVAQKKNNSANKLMSAKRLISGFWIG